MQWDAEQRAAVSAAPGDRQIVRAGPGSGKTQVVLGLITELDEEHDVSPADGVLVVSFSRAAVAAVQGRAAGVLSRPVGVRTLDSLASRILEAVDESDAWRATSFDARVRRATQLLRDDGWDELEAVEHLIVDEVQDVVDIRAEFLLELVRHLPDGAGFTLLGDPMQALYDFQKDGTAMRRSQDLLATVETEFAPVRVVELAGQYRAQSDEMSQIMAAGRTLSAADTRGRLRGVEDLVMGLTGLGPVEGLAPLVRRWGGSSAVLCRTNGEALQVLRRLRESDLRPTVMRGASEVGCHRWVADVLTQAPTDKVSRSWFREHAAGHVDDTETSWLRLRRLSRDRGADLSVREVARRLSNVAPPVDLQTAPEGDVVVSTVHRAKGLEFDNVVLVAPEEWIQVVDPDRAEEEARVAFVAMTRPRTRIARTDRVHDWSVRKDDRSGRWVRSGRRTWQTFGFEVLPTDLRGESVADAEAAQRQLAGKVQVGDAVELHLDKVRSTLEVPHYVVVHDGVEVGRTNEAFGEAFARRLGPATSREVHWPGLSGGVVEGVETTAGDRPGATWGLALGLRMNGLLEVNW